MNSDTGNLNILKNKTHELLKLFDKGYLIYLGRNEPSSTTHVIFLTLPFSDSVNNEIYSVTRSRGSMGQKSSIEPNPSVP